MAWRSRVVALCLSLALLGATCMPVRPTRLAGAGVTIARVEGRREARRLGAPRAERGDYLLSSDRMQLLVGGLERPHEERGAILEARLAGGPAEDSVRYVAPWVRFQGQAVPIEARDIRIAVLDGRPWLRVDGAIHRGREQDRATVIIGIGRTGETVRVLGELAVARADANWFLRVHWGGAAPFVPGRVEGEVEAARYEALWLAREGHAFSTVVGFLRGPLRADAFAEVREGRAGALTYADLAEATAAASDGRLDAVVALGEGGLADALRRLSWVRNVRAPEFVARVPFSPTGAFVRVRDAAGRVLVRSTVAPGAATIVPVITGPASVAEPLRLDASAPGYATSDAVVLSLPSARGVVLDIPRGGSIRVEVSDRQTGLPLAARVLVRSAVGQRRNAATITLDGRTTIPRVAGRYEVFVSHGPEWTLHQETVDVTETFQPRIDAGLAHVIDPGRWVGCDFHVHASPSPDSDVSLEERVRTLVAEGVGFAVATDHNHVTSYADAISSLHVQGFVAISGTEITTADPVIGHFNAFPLTPDPLLAGNGTPPFVGVTAGEVFASVHALGPEVLVQVNHPRATGGIGYFEVFALESRTGQALEGYSGAFDLLEVWNGYDLADPDALERVFGDWQALLASGTHILATGSSDSHHVDYNLAGYPRTYVQLGTDEVLSEHAVIAALRAGRAFVTSGPFLQVDVGGADPGEVARAEGGMVPVRVRVQTPPWMAVDEVQIWRDATLVYQGALGLAPVESRVSGESMARVYDALVSVAVDQDGPIVVRVSGREPLAALFGRASVLPVAFSNPVWVEVAPVDAGAESGSVVAAEL